MRLHRVSGLLLLLAGGYLTYFWARLEFGSSATIADDPIVGVATRYSAQDGRQLFGTWLQAHGGAFWDTFLFYGPKARWHNEPTRPLATGSPIIGATGDLSRVAASFWA